MANSNFYQINYITKIKIANLNGSEGIGGNITTIKKIKSYDDEQYVYISGQALRRYIKETLHQVGEKLSSVDDEGNPQIEGVIEKGIITKDKFGNVIKDVADLDLFGYMLPNDKTLYGRRWSAVKVSPLISLLKYSGEKDFLLRKKNNPDKRDADPVHVEIDTFNFMNGSILVDTSSIGSLINEFTYEKKEVLSEGEKKIRINNFIEAIKNLNGGAKQARLLNDFSYKFVVAIKQKYGNPFLLNSLSITVDGGAVKLDINPIIEQITDYKDVIESINIGLSSNNFSNEDEIKSKVKESLKIDVVSINTALDGLKIK